jgi:hypothetical protein
MTNMNMNLKDKNVLIAGGVVLVVFIAGFFLLNSRKKSTQETKENVLPTAQVLPTVDSSVKVELAANAKKTEVTLTVGQVPNGTTDIEYELSYIAEGDLPKGVIGTIPVEGKKDIERKITLGTCSSGTCVFDKGVEKVKVSLKFNSASGAKIFEKEFAI